MCFVQDGGAAMSDITSEANVGDNMVIWGTDVVISHCKEKFRRFLESYVEAEVAEDERVAGMDVDQPLYLQRLEEVCSTTALRNYITALNDGFHHILIMYHCVNTKFK